MTETARMLSAFVSALIVILAPRSFLPPLLAGQALARWLLLPVGPNVDLVSQAAALGADHPAAEVGQFSFGQIARHVDLRCRVLHGGGSHTGVREGELP